MDVGPVELLIVLAVVLLLFGSKKLPELAKGMGQAAKEFKSGLNDDPEPEKDKVAPAALAVEATPAEVLPAEAATTPVAPVAPVAPVESAPGANN